MSAGVRAVAACRPDDGGAQFLRARGVVGGRKPEVYVTGELSLCAWRKRSVQP